MKISKRLLPATMLCLIANLSNSLAATPLVQSSDEEVIKNKNSVWINQTQSYNIFKVSPDALFDAMGDPIPRITIPLPDGNSLLAEFTEVQRVSGSSVWMGIHSGTPESDVVLSQADSALTGSIHTAGKVYVLEPDKQEYTIIREVVVSALTEAEDTSDNKIKAMGKRQVEINDFSSLHQAGIPDNSVLRVLSLYTDEARIQSGGQKAVIAKLNIAIAQLNRALTKAGLKHQVEVAAHERIGGDNRFRSRGSSFINERKDIRELRDRYKADFVSVLLSNNAPTERPFCGIAHNTMQRSQTLTDIRDYSAFWVSVPCLDVYTYIHEAGHLFGLHHKRGIYRDYGGGYRSDDIRTVMRSTAFCALDSELNQEVCSTKVPYFSSQNGLLNGKRLGNENFNSALVLNETIPILASLYERLPTITHHPESVLLIEGRTLHLEAAAEGAGSLSYQWYKNDQPIEDKNAKSISYQVNEASTADAGHYFVRVTNEHGYSDSFTANVSEIVFTRQPKSKSIKFSKKFRLAAFAKSNKDVSYQWYKGKFDEFDLIPGANSRIYTVLSAGVEDEARYFVKATSAGNSVDSEYAYIDITRVPPASATIRGGVDQCVKVPLRLHADAFHNEPTYRYRWFKDGQLIGREGRSAIYQITSFSSDDVGRYQVEITENFGSHVVLSGFHQVDLLEDEIECSVRRDKAAYDYDYDDFDY